MRRPAAASLPAVDLPGLDPLWSRLVPATGPDGVMHTWHLLDSGTDPDHPALGTLLCVHGNPTWSYLWRRIVAAPPVGWRVIAVDQLGMGYSERLPSPQTLSQRVEDLHALTQALRLSGPVVTVAHDWGGIISLGWALRQLKSCGGGAAVSAIKPPEKPIEIAGIILTNTAVHQPAGSPVPGLIRAARAPGVRQLVCQYSPGFVRAATALSRPALPAAIRDAYAAPYAGARRRAAVADFVADIPLEPQHRSAAALADIADRLPELAHLPVLMLWGPRDPVFSDRYLRDLLSRFPAADVHRFENASHLVQEDRPETATVIAEWVRRLPTASPDGASRPAAANPSAVTGVATADGTALVQLGSRPARVSFSELTGYIEVLGQQLVSLGVHAGSRVALLIPPGLELTVAAYACWRLGATVVVADAGLGLKGMGRALRGAGPDIVLAQQRGLLAARLMRLPGMAVEVGSQSEASRPAGLRSSATRALLAKEWITLGAADNGRGIPTADGQAADGDAAIVFTSGATGPAKGVAYKHAQLQAQVALLRATYAITPADRLVAAFAPFALYAPALGIASVVPDMDVTAPATLTAAALADAIAAVQASLVFAAPAALRNVVATQDQLTTAQWRALALPRLVLSAGAPVPVALQEQIAALLPNAQVHTPYGMTEALPVCDVSLRELQGLSDDDGVCVGAPVRGVQVGISALDQLGRAAAAPSAATDVVGEICVRASHLKQRYDRLWAIEADSGRDPGWHRTGDVGLLDDRGRLWVQGRLRDVISTAAGPLTPVPTELKIACLPGVQAAALVGVGPSGTQHAVAVVVLGSEGTVSSTSSSARVAGFTLAPASLTDEVRALAGGQLAAVFVTDALPVDIRHNSKVDRAALAAEATRLLSGGRAASVPRLPKLALARRR